MIESLNEYQRGFAVTQGELRNCYMIAAFDQILTKADFILDKIWIFESPLRDSAFIILNIDGRPELVDVEFDLPKLSK